MKLRIIIVICAVLIFNGCGKKGDTTGPDKKPDIPAITLLSPTKSEVCTNGEVISVSQSRVTFKWATMGGTSAYTVAITNLLNYSTQTESSATNTVTSVLDRGVPYSWKVSAKTASGVINSDTWRFYNAGIPATGYAPFPAVAKSPAQGANLYEGDKINLYWEATSVDNNIKNYDIYFGTSPIPPLYKKEVPGTATEYLTLVKATYYWKIITRDTNGNTSESQLFQFTVR